MVLDYSKWDKLELSDDSDFEPHPNVDKRSFIRAKQNKIHMERQQRRHQIETLKYERKINDGLLTRVNKLINSLESQEPQKEAHGSAEQVYNALVEVTGDPSQDQFPPRPEGVHEREGEPPTYSTILATLVDQVKKEIDQPGTDNGTGSYITKLSEHATKIKGLEDQLEEKLAELETEESRKITSDKIHTGFDSTFVNKSDKAKPKSKPKATSEATVEQLNVGAMTVKDKSHNAGDKNDQLERVSKDGDDDDDDDDDSTPEASSLGKDFARIKIGQYQQCLEFIVAHPDIVQPRETDGLLAEAFDGQLAGKEDYARQCVHQALLLQYCRSLGRDGIGLFFKRFAVRIYTNSGTVLTPSTNRVMTKGHQGQQVFYDDVNSTYTRIGNRCRDIKAQQESSEGKEVEQIQLHPVEPGTSINIIVPALNSEEEVERQARAVFETFSPSLQKALESGSLDQVNKVLGEMSVEEAEGVVAKLGEGGMLSLQEQIIDATTEEGQKHLREIEEQAKKEQHATDASAQDIGDPD
ncbi:MAG: hsp90 co-chaperone Cdc37 [Lichina confinis]|nr:MAG: hsp90 co-chaperone Cdc37 [Lichina confinis]